MCLGTFSRLARSLATVYIFARVRTIEKDQKGCTSAFLVLFLFLNSLH